MSDRGVCGLCGHEAGTCADCDFCDGFVHGLTAGRAEVQVWLDAEKEVYNDAITLIGQLRIELDATEAKLAEVQKRIDEAPRAWFVEYDTGGSMMGHAYKPDTTWDPSYEAPRLVRLVPE